MEKYRKMITGKYTNPKNRVRNFWGDIADGFTPECWCFCAMPFF